MGDGDCFIAAVKTVQWFAGDARVVHGTPMNQVYRQRYWHAWVELGEMVFDFSNGREVIMPRSLYYAIGKLDEEHVWRFTKKQAAEEMSTHGHYGPWVDGWETMTNL